MEKSKTSAHQALSTIETIKNQLSNQRQKWTENRQPGERIIDQKGFDSSTANLSKGLDTIKHSLENQIGALKGMKNIKKDAEKDGLYAENKLYLESFLEVIERDLISLLKLSKQRTNAPYNEKKNQEVDLTTEEREQLYWRKKEEKLKDRISEIKLQAEQANNPFELIFKYLNLRDAMIIQNIKALLYQQQILFKDINFPPNEFVHNEVYKILSSIQQQKEKAGFIQPKYNFEKTFVKSYAPFKMEENREGEVEEDKNNYFALTQFVQLTAESFDQFEALIRNIFGLTNVDKENAINNSKVVTQSLRQQLQTSYSTISDLERKLQHLSNKIKSDDQTDEEVLKKEIRDKDNLIQDLQRDIKNMNNELVKAEKTNQILKHQHNQLQENHKKLVGNYFPKLDEVADQIKKTIEGIEKLRKEVEFLFSMVRVEKIDKSKADSDKKMLDAQVEKLALKMGQYRNTNRLLKVEIVQKDKVCFELAKAVEEYKTKAQKLEKELEIMKIEADPTRAEELKTIEEQRKAQQIVAKFQGQMKRQDTFKSSQENKMEKNPSRKESSLDPKNKEKISINNEGEPPSAYQKKNSLPKNQKG